MKRKHLWIIILVLSLILAGLVGIAVGKYVQEQSFSGKVTFTAKLADRVILQEQTAQRQPDGSYRLQAPFVQENTYVLLPGLDIPKDPHIIIEGKTSIPAYLFVEVVDTVGNDGISWSVDTDLWEAVPGAAGNVYVYKTVLTGATTAPIYILEANQIHVSQHLNCDGAAISGPLTFRVKLIQKYEDADPLQAYLGYTG